jgi:hypothetical protein
MESDDIPIFIHLGPTSTNSFKYSIRCVYVIHWHGISFFLSRTFAGMLNKSIILDCLDILAVIIARNQQLLASAMDAQ